MFSEHTIERARHALPHLIECAQKGKTITYGELADRIGVHHRAIPPILYYLRDEICIPRNLPLITAIVIHKADHRPGDSWLPGGTRDLTEEEKRCRFEEAREEVFAYQDWDDPIHDLDPSLAPERMRGMDTREQVRSLSAELSTAVHKCIPSIGSDVAVIWPKLGTDLRITVLSWLAKRCSIHTCRRKKPENWPSHPPACAGIVFNLAFYG